MKTFKYKFSTLQKVLIILGMLLSAAGFTVNLIFCLKDGIGKAANPLYPILQYALMFFVTVVLFVLLLTILLLSAYTVDNKYFKTRFGFITSKYEIAKMTGVTLDRRTNKLTVSFVNNEFIVVVVKQQWYEDFIGAVLAANPAIEYSIISLENEDTDNNNKKK